MKNMVRYSLVLLVFFVASAALAGVPTMSVIVSSADGKGAFRGTTNADGVFKTDKLAPGNYVVQIKSSDIADKQYLVVVSAGRKKVTADSVAGAKFAGGGVALRVPVGSSNSIIGQVVTEEALSSNVRFILGRRYFWLPGHTGTNLGRWVEEGTVEAKNLYVIDLASVQRFQDRAGEGSMSSHPELIGH